jgi:SPP1 gp7 family putative phage head morphogenesis protein
MIKLPTLANQLQRPRRQPVLRPVLKPLRYPYGPEQQYEVELHQVVELALRGIREDVLPSLPGLLKAGDRALPRADALSTDLKAMIASLRSTFGVSAKDARTAARGMLEQVSDQHAESFAQAYERALPAINPLAGNEDWLPEAMRLATEQNVALIKSIPDDFFTDVERIVSQAVQSGRSAPAVADELMARFGVTERRATVIARDQTSKWMGALNQHRQVDAGVEQYDWQTSGDERVRATHRARDGKRYRWNGDETKPGEEVLCRCQPIPVLPEFDE